MIGGTRGSDVAARRRLVAQTAAAVAKALVTSGVCYFRISAAFFTIAGGVR
jgi:hypothetical protein